MADNQWVLENFGRVDLMPNEFDKEIYQKGVRIVWEKSCLCSCLDPHTGQGDFGCPACKGRGYTYFDPQPIRAVVNGMTGDKNQIPIGLMDVGTSLMTTMSKDGVGFRDRLTFVDFRTSYSQVVSYSSAGTPMKYACMEFTQARVLSSAIDDSLITFSEDRQTMFIDPSAGLAEGERIAVLYRIQPTYIVIDIPHELRGTFVKFGNPEEKWMVLPRQFLIKREDLLPLQRGEVMAP